MYSSGLWLFCKGSIWKAKLTSMVEHKKLFDSIKGGSTISVPQMNVVFN
jgi:hypothetical protein